MFQIVLAIYRVTDFLSYGFLDLPIFDLRVTEKSFEVVFTDLLHGNWMKTVI